MEFQLVLHNCIDEIPRLAEFVDMVCEAAQADYSVSMSLNLALEEAVTNVMLYAYPEGKEGELRVDCTARPGHLLFALSDEGEPFDPTQVADADVSLDVKERPIGGLGIFLVRQIMDQVSYERKDGKNVLIMTKKFSNNTTTNE